MGLHRRPELRRGTCVVDPQTLAHAYAVALNMSARRTRTHIAVPKPFSGPIKSTHI